MDSLNERYSIKNLLFSKAIPNYTLPVPTSGYKVYGCSDCGDKFLFQSSYDYHLTRKSVKISYFCRHCNSKTVFYNRCNLLSHIRGHTFKSATINVSDLKIEPLPLKFFEKILTKSNGTKAKKKTTNDGREATTKVNSVRHNAMGFLINPDIESEKCPECDMIITTKANSDNNLIHIYMDRAKHYMTVTEEIYTCPVCLFALPTMCAFKTHLRLHFRCGPYFCPECGINLPPRITMYPYMNHNCEGFKMLRASTRVKCPVPDCHLLNPADFRDHLKNSHLQVVYKCSECYVACFEEATMYRHIQNHDIEVPKKKAHSLQFYQCLLCPGKLIFYQQISNHIKNHSYSNFMFPCWVCGTVFSRILSLLEHHTNDHAFSNNAIKEWFKKIVETQKNIESSKKSYRVVKKCDQCQRSFSYKCEFKQIDKLPNECPYKCSKDSQNKEEPIKCFICKNKVSQNWEDIKKHFEEHHPTQKCLDIKIFVSRMNIKKYLNEEKNKTQGKVIKKRDNRKKKSKRNQNEVENVVCRDNGNNSKMGEFVCKKCGQDHENKQLLEKHLLIHRDLCMAYQCMECGQCFVVKPSFSTHLVLEHNIINVDDYITEKQCYNEDALLKHQDQSIVNEPLKENQCKICRDQFENPSDLEKHFRVHGMAFLMKNNSNKNVSP